MSETIVAAIIGALATVVTAVFQLIRNRAPSESRPKKNRMRSALATAALAIACIVGGYAWSSLRAVSAKEELRATMKAEFAEQFAALVERKQQAAADVASVTASRGDTTAEALVHLPPCRIDSHPDEVGPVSCSDRSAQVVALCATLPSAALTSSLRLMSRVPGSELPWQERDAGAPTLGSLRIGEAVEDFPVSAHERSVCLDVANWSVEDTLAVRLIVDYAMAPKTSELTASTPGAASL